MAVPVTITTGPGANSGYAGPFLSSGGNVYVFLCDTTNAQIDVWKATDPTSSFSNVASLTMTSSKSPQAIDCVQVGDTIHIATENYAASTSVDIRYHAFSMSSDTFTTSNETIKAAFDTGDNQGGIGLNVRSGGDLVVLYNGLKSTSMGADHSKVKYARKVSGTWTIDVAVDNAAVGTSWNTGGAVLGASDRSHFFFSDATNSAGYQRTLTSANSLESLPAAYDSTIDLSIVAYQLKGVSYVSGGTTKVRYPYLDSTISQLNIAKEDSADTPTTSTDVDISGTTDALRGAWTVCLTADGTDLYAVFIASSSNDTYFVKNADGAGWGTATSIRVVAATKLSANVYTRSSTKYLAIVYDEGGGVVKYDEYSLGTSGPTGADLTATAAATATFASKSTAADPFTMAAAELVTATGAARASDPFTMAATAAVTWGGTGLYPAAFTDTAAAAVTWTGATLTISPAAFTDTAAAAVTWAGTSTASANLSAAALAVVTWTGAATGAVAYNMAAVASLTAVGASTASADLTAAALASVTWNGQALVVSPAAFTQAAAATVTWNSITFLSGDLSGAAAATLTWNGTSFAASSFTDVAAAAVTWNGTGLYPAALNAAAVALVTWEGTNATAGSTVSADASMTAAAAVSWSAASIGSATLTAAAAATLTWNTITINNGAWSAAALASVTWGGTGLAPAAFTQTALANLAAVGAETASGAFSDVAAAILSATGQSFASAALAATAAGNLTATGAAVDSGAIIAAAAASVTWAGQALGGTGNLQGAAVASLSWAGETISPVTTRNIDGWVRANLKRQEDLSDEDIEDIVAVMQPLYYLMVEYHDFY